MNKKQLLVISNPGNMHKELFSWISSTEGFDMAFADDHEKAVELSNQQLFDVVVIDQTDADVNARMLTAILPILNAEALLIGYKGETQDELNEKIELAFNMRRIKRMKQLLILDSSTDNGQLPFSLN